ncbi:MAG: hypothetical protein AMXMBFR12_07120 [Candidatus Babeliales bacterium]
MITSEDVMDNLKNMIVKIAKVSKGTLGMPGGFLEGTRPKKYSPYN